MIKHAEQFIKDFKINIFKTDSENIKTELRILFSCRVFETTIKHCKDNVNYTQLLILKMWLRVTGAKQALVVCITCIWHI